MTFFALSFLFTVVYFICGMIACSIEKDDRDYYGPKRLRVLLFWPPYFVKGLIHVVKEIAEGWEW